MKLHIELDGEKEKLDPNNIVVDNELTIETWEIFAAILKCGNSPVEYLPQKMTVRIEEILLKKQIVEFALTENHGYLSWDTKRLDELDSSEKGFVSYYVGMIMATLLSSKLYGVDYLCHFKRFIKLTGAVMVADGEQEERSHSEPDYIGLAYGEDDVKISVFEAKGGKDKNSESYEKARKTQLWSVRKISKQCPERRILFYSIMDKGVDKLSFPEGGLKVIIAEQTELKDAGLNNYDVEIANKSIVDVFSDEFMKLSDVLAEETKKGLNWQSLGNVRKENNNEYRIEYSKHDEIRLVIENNRFMKVFHHKIFGDGCNATVSSRVDKLNVDGTKGLYQSVGDTIICNYDRFPT